MTDPTTRPAGLLGLDLDADAAELLQLVGTGCVEVRRVTTEDGIVTTFGLLDLTGSQRHTRPVAPKHIRGNTRALTRCLLSAARHGYVDLLWDKPDAPWYLALATGAVVLTPRAEQALIPHWPRLSAQGPDGRRGWKRNPTEQVPRALLMPGNIVHSGHSHGHGHGVRFQIGAVHRHDGQTQLCDAHSEHTETDTSALALPVEVASLLPGQQIR